MDTAVSEVPQVRKKEYRNNTAGWIGVVILDHQGREQGVNIEPLGTIWLSDAEAILTARAPRHPADNPFEERGYVMQDAVTQQRREVKMRPVTLVSNVTRDMYSSDRYVPGIVDDQTQRALAERAAHEGTPVVPSPAALAREASITGVATPLSSGAVDAALGQAPDAPARTPVPPMQATRVEQLAGTPGATDSELDLAPSWTEPAPAPGVVLAGALSGADDRLSDPATDPTLPAPGDTTVPPVVQAAPQTVGAALGAEEHAARVDPAVGEETGAAPPPATPQPEGEYASAEEVGSPKAPRARKRPVERTEGLIAP